MLAVLVSWSPKAIVSGAEFSPESESAIRKKNFHTDRLQSAVEISPNRAISHKNGF